jgi:hypothetical protein
MAERLAGIAPAAAPAFIAAQLSVMAAAVALSRWLWPGR